MSKQEGKFIVGVVGTQNTGKSTFIKDIVERFKGTENEFKTVGCDYRKKIEEKGLKINRNGNWESQNIIFDTLVEQLDIIDEMPDGNYLTDRTPLDAYVYTTYLWQHGLLGDIRYEDLCGMYDRLCAEMGRYDKIVFLDLDNCSNVKVVDDKFRDTDAEYRKEIDGLFKKVIASLEDAGILKGNVERDIYGTREERLAKFNELRELGKTPMSKDPPQKMDKMYEYGYRVTDNYVFFFGSFMSNFARCKFLWTFNGERHEFFCTEQAFMWAKAKFFGDEETAQKILDEDDDPLVCKHLGREVKGYDDEKWNEVRYNIMFEVNLARFQQCGYHRKKLLDPELDGKTFVEASPVDGIWGIKMGIKDEGILNSSNWRGQNLMGKVITDVRKRLMTLQNDDNLV